MPLLSIFLYSALFLLFSQNFTDNQFFENTWDVDEESSLSNPFLITPLYNISRLGTFQDNSKYHISIPFLFKESVMILQIYLLYGIWEAISRTEVTTARFQIYELDAFIL